MIFSTVSPVADTPFVPIACRNMAPLRTLSVMLIVASPVLHTATNSYGPESAYRHQDLQ